MKKILSLLLALTLVLALAACGDDSASRDDDSEETKGGSSINATTKGEDPAPSTEPTEAPSKTITTFTYDEATKTLTIYGDGKMPDYYNIGARRYEEYAGEATRIVVEEGCSYIGVNAFYDFPLVTEVSLPDSLLAIGDHAFKRCSSLTEVELPRHLQRVGSLAFENCESLTKVTVHEDIQDIYSTAFNGCPVEYTMADGIGYLGNSENPYVVAATADECLYQESYTIADTCLVIGGNLFGGSIMESIVIPDSVKHICGGAFRSSGLSSVTLPKNLLTLGEECFKGIRGLTQIVLPETVTSIGANAFKECYDLTTITLPGSLTEIGNNAFMSTDISEMTFNGTLAQWETITKEESGTKAIVHCTDGDVEY